MIEVILGLLQTTDSTAPAVLIAKGQNKLPENRKELAAKFKEIWLKKK